MTLPEKDSDWGSENRVNLRVALVLALLCAMVVFALLAIQAGESATAVAGLAVALCTAAGTVAVHVVPGARAGRRRSWGPPAATEDPPPRDR